MGFIHRDIKPDNILIGADGHIKLSDFGLCKQADINNEEYFYQDLNSARKIDFRKLGANNKHSNMMGLKKKDRKLAFSAVGTPDYIAPEMLTRKGYDETVDWWSIGIMIYEMLIGYAPFSAETNQEIYYKISNHQDYLFFPPEVQLSEDVVDIVSRLVTGQESRLGKNGVAEIQKHKWFRGVNWENVRKMKPPFVPQVQNQTDVKYFDKYEEQEPWIYNPKDQQFKKDFNFIGYTYKEEEENLGESEEVFNKAIKKLETQKQNQCEKQKQWLDLLRKNMKKKVANFNETKIGITRKMIEKATQKSCITNVNKSDLYTDRSRQGIKSKSPLAERDVNVIKKKQPQQHSKSPINSNNLQPQKSSTCLRKIQVACSSTLFQQTQPLSRKSINNRK